MTIDLKNLVALADGLRQKSQAPLGTTSNRKWYTIQNKGDEAVIGIYDMIGEWGVTAKDFLEDLANIDAKKITVQISSEGGEVYDGLAIYAGLASHPAEITTDVISHAFSAASFIAQAGKYRRVRKNARMMIHNARIMGGVAVAGDAEAVERMAKALSDVASELRNASDNLADIYAERSGKGDRAHWKALMAAETYFNAEEAVQNGLADEVVGADGRVSNMVIPVVTNTATPEVEEPSSAFDSLLRIFQEV